MTFEAKIFTGSFDDLAAAERAEQVVRAQAVAVAAHVGQTDKLGVDYVQHPAAVAAPFDPEREALEHCAGWLHDVIEDTDVNAERLRLAGIHPDVIRVVEMLTRHEGQGDEYYAAIAADPAARAVKRADIAHNTDPARTAQLDLADRARLREKYDRALKLLGFDPVE